MDYIISALSEATTEKIEIISASSTSLFKFVKGSKQSIGKNITLKTFSTFNSKIKLFRAISYFLMKLFILIYLIFKTKAKDKVIVYHSLSLMRVLQIARKIKKFKLVIEVEEIYSDVKKNIKLRKKEIKYLKTAYGYIFITELLNKEINSNKPYCIAHGTYKSNRQFNHSFNDNKIHIVYAGTFSNIKNGAVNAIELSQYLDEKYVIHVMGKGTQKDTENVINKINDLSRKVKCKLIYAGYKSGDEFNAYVQACHIGLCSQNSKEKFNETSFPSKILMYMSNGLTVLSIRTEAISTSKVSDLIYYYNDDKPQNIAQIIKDIKIDEGNKGRLRIDELNQDFIKDLRQLIKSQ